MPWDRTQPSDSKYASPEHRALRAALLAELARLGTVECAQPMCIMASRTIYDGDPTHLGHADDGVEYIGLVHAQCNRVDGAKRGAAIANGRRRGTGGRGACAEPTEQPEATTEPGETAAVGRRDRWIF